MIEIRILENEKLAEWNSIVAQFPDAAPFHTLEWLTMLEQTYHLKKLPLGLYRDGKIAGLFPLLMARKGPFKILGSPLTGWGTLYMGPLIDAELLDETMRAFVGFVKGLKVDYIEVRFPQADLVLPSMNGFQKEQVYTYIVKLEGSKDQAWKKLTKTCRKNIRKALRNDVKVVETEDRNWVEDFYPMLQMSYAKTGQMPTKSKEFYYNLWDCMKPTGKLKVFFAEYEGRKIAGHIYLANGNTIYSTASGSYSEYNGVAPNNLIHWHFMDWAVTNGFRKYDMAGKGIPSIDRFKESFGPDVSSYTKFHRANSISARLGRAAYGKLELAGRILQYRITKLRGSRQKAHETDTPQDKANTPDDKED